jgi:hypothetical protein
MLKLFLLTMYLSSHDEIDFVTTPLSNNAENGFIGHAIFQTCYN